MADNEDDRIQRGILGDITPEPSAAPGRERAAGGHENDEELLEPQEGGSRHDDTQHPGSRDVTEGTTGGTGAETGGTRNYRTGTGATGTDIGNRPE